MMMTDIDPDVSCNQEGRLKDQTLVMLSSEEERRRTSQLRQVAKHGEQSRETNRAS